jgi:hypothetical protein
LDALAIIRNLDHRMGKVHLHLNVEGMAGRGSINAVLNQLLDALGDGGDAET